MANKVFGMKLLYLLGSCFLLLGCVNKQHPDYTNSSGFDRAYIDSTALDNLEVLGRVWGYVKYHHPVFADSIRNVDYDLFDLLPKVAAAERKTRNRILTEWIDELGLFPVDKVKYDSLPPDLIGRQKIDLDWIQDTMRLGSALSHRLTRLRYADRNGNYHVTKTHISGPPNPCFTNEKTYENLKYPDYGYRLLAVFRFWNIVEYFYPSKYLIERSWSDVLPEYIVRMASLSEGDYLHVMWRMIAEIQDNHAQSGSYQLFGDYRVPVHTCFVEGRLLVASPDTLYITGNAERKLFDVGDEIVAVNHKPISYYISQVRKYVPCSNEGDVLQTSADIALRMRNNTGVKIRYCRNGYMRDTLVQVQKMPPVEMMYLFDQHSDFKIYADSIGYIYPSKYLTRNRTIIEHLLHRTKGLVIDLRCYPTDDFLDFLARNIIPAPSIKTAVVTYPDIILPGVFSSYTAGFPTYKCEKYDQKIVVLVNSITQSYAETSVQLIQENPLAITIGTQSAGANGNISNIVLPGGIVTRFSGLGWYYDDSTEVQRRGVKIDIEVRPTIEGVMAGRDEMLEKAIEIITQSYPKICKRVGKTKNYCFMKKLQLKKEIVAAVDNASNLILGGQDPTIVGDSGGTLCVSKCKPCPGTVQSRCEICPPPPPGKTMVNCESVPMNNCGPNPATGKTLCQLCW